VFIAGGEAGVVRAGGARGSRREARDRDAEQRAGAGHGALRLPEHRGGHQGARPDRGRPDQGPAVTASLVRLRPSDHPDGRTEFIYTGPSCAPSRASAGNAIEGTHSSICYENPLVANKNVNTKLLAATITNLNMFEISIFYHEDGGTPLQLKIALEKSKILLFFVYCK